MTTTDAIVAIEQGTNPADLVAQVNPANVRAFDCRAAGDEWMAQSRVDAYWRLLAAVDAAPAAPARVRAVSAAPARREMTCRHCGTTGRVGAVPFSTNPSSGLCDDCGA